MSHTTPRDFDSEEITADFRIHSGVIQNPGKFEGEPPWVPLLWDRILSGFSDVSVHDGSMAIDAFALDDAMATLTGLEARPGCFVALWESEQGFVTHMVMTEQELNECEGFDVESYDLGGMD